MRIVARPAVAVASVALVALVLAAPRALADEGAAPDATGASASEPATGEEKELAWARGTGNPQDIGTALVAVAHMRVRAGQPERAFEPIGEALEIANAIGDDSLGRAAAMAMSDAYHAQRDYPAAERWVEQANAYRDRVPGRYAPSEALLAAKRLIAAQGGAPAPATEPSTDAAAPTAQAPATTPVQPAAPVAPPPAAEDGAAPPGASPADARALTELLRRMRWVFLVLALLLAALLWSVVRRGSSLGARSDRLAREQRLLATVHRTLRQETEKNRRVAREDTLTGALSRDAFAHELERLLAHGAALSRPVALMVLDLDRFKEINDRHGHLAGDAALKLAVDGMKAELDDGALLGRYGGDEFLVACFDRTFDQALQLAERIRLGVREASRSDPSEALRGVTLSIGVALAVPGRAHTVEGLFRRADAALYAAKKAGRDRAMPAGDEPLTA